MSELERFAELTGFDPDETGEFEPEALLSEEEAGEFEQEESGWSSDPRVRFGVIAGGVGFLTLGGAYLFGGGLSPSLSPSEPEGEVSVQTEAAGDKEDKSNALREENAELKTRLALRSQEQLSEEAQAEKPEPEDKSQPAKASKEPQATSPPTPPPTVSPQPVRRTTPPPPSPVVRSVPISPQPRPSLPVAVPARQPLPQPARSIAPPESFPLVESSTSDPTKKLAEVGELGSYGAGQTVPQASPVVSVSVRNRSSQSPVEPVSESPREPQQQEPSVVAGSTAAATLETSVFENESFTVTLTEPLGAVQAGTRVIGRTTRIEQNSGIATVMLTAIIIDGREQPLPEGAVTLRGQAGEPLIAQAFGVDEGSSGVGNIGRTLLRGSVRGLTRELTSNIDNDLLSGIAEEVSSEVADSFLEKNETRQASRKATWYVPKRTSVQLFVNRSFALEGVSEESRPSTALEPPARDNTLTEIPLPAESSPVLVAAREPAPLPVAPEFSPAEPPEKPQPVQPVSPQPRMMSDAPLIKVWAGSGTNISFLTAGETVTRAWLDDPSLVALDFDQPLCSAGGGQGCSSGSPSVVHLRLIEGIEFDHLPSGSGTLLTVITQDLAGKQRLHAFRIERGTGVPEYHTLEMPPS